MAGPLKLDIEDFKSFWNSYINAQSAVFSWFVCIFFSLYPMHLTAAATTICMGKKIECHESFMSINISIVSISV